MSTEWLLLGTTCYRETSWEDTVIFPELRFRDTQGPEYHNLCAMVEHEFHYRKHLIHYCESKEAMTLVTDILL